MEKRGQRLLNLCVWLFGVQLCAMLMPVQAGAASPIVAELPVAIGLNTSHAVVPLAPMLEALGATLTESATGEFIVTRQKKTFSFALGSFVAHANGKELTLPLAPIKVDEQIFLPLQPLVTALGGRIRLKNEKKVITFHLTLPGVKLPFTLLFVTISASKQDEAGNTVPLSVQEVLERIYNTQQQLFVMHADGSGIRQLTHNLYGTRLPSFSADDKRYVTMRTMDSQPFGFPMYTRTSTNPQSVWTEKDVFKDIKVVTDKESVVVKGECSFLFASAMLSLDGAVIVYDAIVTNLEEKQSYSIIYRRPFQGGKPQKLAQGTTPGWSPDGRTIAYAVLDAEGENPVIHLISADGRSTQVVGAGEEPLFSPDGGSLLFLRKYGEGGKSCRMTTICRFGNRPGDFTFIEAPVEQRDHYEMDAVFTPDSEQILFARYGAGIYVMKSDRSECKQLTAGEEDAHPVCSPDGSQVFFLRDEQIFRVKIDGSELTPITKDLRINDFTLSTDGSSIFFTHQPREPEY